MLTALRFHRYRAFDDWTELALKPLTVLFGYNNSGKSAALRLLPGLAESTTPRDAAPLHLDGDVYGGAQFTDISHRGGPEVGFELEWSPSASTLVRTAKWVLRAETTSTRRWVDALFVKTVDGAEYDLTWSDAGERFEAYKLAVSGDDAQSVGELDFEGLVPKPRPDFLEHVVGVYTALDRQMKGLSSAVRWIGSHRGAVGRSRSRVRSNPRRVRFDADDAADVLAAFEDQHGKALTEQANLVYGDIGHPESMVPLQGESLDLQPVHQLALDFSMGGRYALRLSRAGGASRYAPNLADAGEGMTQILPLAVALGQIQAKAADAPHVLCIEQPELHLHPRAQQAIAEHLVDAAMTHPERRIIVETHAHHVMLAIQVALAEGRLSPDNVLIYWVRQDRSGDSRLERVELDELGRDVAGRWPPDVFGDDAKMARRLIRARRDRSFEAR